jgi:hypothetical protein
MELFNIEIINPEDLFELVIRFLFNLAVIFIIVRFIYYKVRKRKDYLFTK